MDFHNPSEDHDPRFAHIDDLLRLDGELTRAQVPADLAHRAAMASMPGGAADSMRLEPSATRRGRSQAWMGRLAMAAAIGLACVVVLRPGTQQPVAPVDNNTIVFAEHEPIEDTAVCFLECANTQAEEQVSPLIDTYTRAGENFDVLSMEMLQVAAAFDAESGL